MTACPPLNEPLRPLRREWEKSLQIIQGDVLKVPLPFFDVLVANVPYNVSVRGEITLFFFQAGFHNGKRQRGCKRHVKGVNMGSGREGCANEALAASIMSKHRGNIMRGID